ncbi:MAG: hypothetical protein ACREVQ_14670 [Burkholderiales bacterium]
MLEGSMDIQGILGIDSDVLGLSKAAARFSSNTLAPAAAGT